MYLNLLFQLISFFLYLIEFLLYLLEVDIDRGILIGEQIDLLDHPRILKLRTTLLLLLSSSTSP